ncbi:O-antigen ligase family protein, partial [Ilumatobacter sp.]|uniref:O-antigen ligase family protein n=1 Tax=Ilumatobacter sp. TaxID=1967498 RepID=UPI003C3245CE
TNVSSYTPRAPKAAGAGSSEGARLEAWRSSGSAFQESPVTGIGWGNLGTHFDRDAALGLRNERIATFEHAHNQLIGAAANGGLIGLAAVCALFAVPLLMFGNALRSSSDRQRTLGLTGIIVVGAYATFGLTEAILENLAPLTVLAVIVAALCSELGAVAIDDSAIRRSTRRVPRELRESPWRVQNAPVAHWTIPPFGTRH